LNLSSEKPGFKVYFFKCKYATCNRYNAGFCDAASPAIALECGDTLAAAVNCSGGGGANDTDTARCLRSLDVQGGSSPFWDTVKQAHRLASPSTQQSSASDDGSTNNNDNNDDNDNVFNVTMQGCFAPSYGAGRNGGGGGGGGGVGSKPPEKTMWSDPKRVCKVPVIVGTTAEEGSLFIPLLLSDAEKTSVDFDGAFIKGLLRGALGMDDLKLESALAASYGVSSVSPSTSTASTTTTASASAANDDGSGAVTAAAAAEEMWQRRNNAPSGGDDVAAAAASAAAAAAATAAAASAAAEAAALVEPRTQFAATSAALGDWLFTCPTLRAARALSYAFAATSSSANGTVGLYKSHAVVP
jgi:hypothetical protein